jgi:hypothetical protein
MREKLHLIYVATSLVLAIGCSVKPASKPENAPDLPVFHEASYSFQYPHLLKYRFERDDGSFALATNSGASFIDGPNDYFLEVFNLKDVSCDLGLIGTSNVLKRDQILWGKIDFFERHGNDYLGGTPHCRPWLGSGYGMCAKKNGETIVICLSQVTDNPEIAKQIFKSFQWADDER